MVRFARCYSAASVLIDLVAVDLSIHVGRIASLAGAGPRPAYRTWFARGGGSNATSRSTRSSAVSTCAAVPPDHARFRPSRPRPPLAKSRLSVLSDGRVRLLDDRSLAHMTRLRADLAVVQVDSPHLVLQTVPEAYTTAIQAFAEQR